MDAKKEINMTINYNVDHKLLAFPVFTETKLTTTERLVTFIVFSQIVHWSKNAGSCILYKNQLSKDLGPKREFFTKATKLLEEYKMIKCIKPYQRATQSAAVYQVAPAYIRLRSKLYPAGNKAGIQREQVNNINNIIKENDSFNKESSPKYRPNENPTATWK